MSAYLVPQSQIQYLVDASMALYSRSLYWYWGDGPRTLYSGDRTEAQRVGQMLWEANARSVAYRYEAAAEPVEFELVDVMGEIHPLAVLAAVKCYRYQACEHPQYEVSEAEAFVRALESSAISVLVEGYVWGGPEIISGRWGRTWGSALRAERDAPEQAVAA